MLWWISVLLISPLWAGVSTQLFVQAWLAFTSAGIGLLGLMFGKADRKNAAMMLGVGLLQTAVYGVGLRIGFWLLTDLFGFGYTRGENFSYWVFVALTLLVLLPQVPSRVKNSWGLAMVPGFLEASIAAGKAVKHRA